MDFIREQVVNHPVRSSLIAGAALATTWFYLSGAKDIFLLDKYTLVDLPLHLSCGGQVKGSCCFCQWLSLSNPRLFLPSSFAGVRDVEIRADKIHPPAANDPLKNQYFKSR